MYQQDPDKKKAKTNPKKTANIISLITFFFTHGIFTKSRKRDLEETDIYDVMPAFKSSLVGDHLEKEYEILKMRSEEPSIYKLLWKCYGPFYLFWGVIHLTVKTIMVLIQPRALGKLVAYFTPNQTALTKSDAIYYACIVLGLQFLYSAYGHNYMMVISELGMKVRTAFCSLMYRKALRLKQSALSEITVGKIVTLISKDVHNFDSALIFMNDIWICTTQIVITTYLIYSRLGNAAFAGIGFLVLVIPLQLFVGRMTTKLRMKASKATDERLQVTQETLTAIKIIKMYTWEKFFGDRIAECRHNEVKKIKNIYYAKATSLVIGGLVLNITLYIIVMTYTKTGNYLTAEVTFFLLSCLQILRSVVTIQIPLGIAQTAELVASVKRINNLLRAAESRKSKKSSRSAIPPMIFFDKVQVMIKDKIILHDVNLKIDSGFTFITGRVGAGKSSLLKTILEDYEISDGFLRVQGGLSYASEEPWLFPSTIRQNILFGEEYDKARYEKVLQVCALQQDIDSFKMGDSSIVDDRGMNLSKGQQARINLARAVYKDSDVYLLDDCLSSLDTHVQDFVFRECIKKFLRSKIVVMISNNEKFVKYTDKVVIMEDGTIKSCLKPTEISEGQLQEIVREPQETEDQDIIDKIQIDTAAEEPDEDSETADEKSKLLLEQNTRLEEQTNNIYHEVKQVGKVDKQVYLKYLRHGGGLCIFVLILLVFLVAQGISSYSEKLVTNWVNVQQNLSDYQKLNLTNSSQYHNLDSKSNSLLKWYTITIVTSTLLILLRAFLYFSFCSRASARLHNSMARSIVNSTMNFFDLHYFGNILNRFSKDLGTVDEYIPFVIYECLRIVCIIAGIVLLIASVNKIFLIPAAVVFIIMYIIRTLYLPASRSLKRLESATRSPVLGHLNASLEGLTTIKAYNTESILKKEFDKHQDLYTSAFHMLNCAGRAFGFTLDFICNVFISVIVLRFLIFDRDTEAGNVGLAINQAFMLTGILQWGIRQWAELENQMTSVERVLEYTEGSQGIKMEDKNGDSPPDWPKSGQIVYEDVDLFYGQNHVLKNINFTIKAGSKVGMVGRTGAGKSSIISTLFRLYQSQGKITIDGTETSTLSLDYLRSKIAIIPQEPILFTGTLRTNIDPLNRFSDEAIWKALERVKTEGLTLELKITEGGSNFSSGQRQLICLARAVVSNNNIIILDEATANMDPETDLLIHDTIRDSFSSCTVLTVAHRLHSVLDSDFVMVVDRGEIVEFDSPETLLANSEGMFYKMFKQANLLKKNE